MAISFQVTFDCADPDQLAAFWALALGYKIPAPPAGFATWPEFLKTQGWLPEELNNSRSALVDPAGIGPRLFFQKVPEPKAAKNRVHLDVNVGGAHGTPAEERRRAVEAHIARLTEAGASEVTRFDEHGESWVVMADPEGNEFCLQ